MRLYTKFFSDSLIRIKALYYKLRPIFSFFFKKVNIILSNLLLEHLETVYNCLDLEFL